MFDFWPVYSGERFRASGPSCLNYLLTFYVEPESVFTSEYSYMIVSPKHLMANIVGTPRRTRDVTLWLSRTTDNLNFFIGSREVRDNERRL